MHTERFFKVEVHVLEFRILEISIIHNQLTSRTLKLSVTSHINCIVTC